MVMDAAEKQDRDEDVRTEASMIKVFATEMATEVVDNAMQSFRGHGHDPRTAVGLHGAAAAPGPDL